MVLLSTQFCPQIKYCPQYCRHLFGHNGLRVHLPPVLLCGRMQGRLLRALPHHHSRHVAACVWSCRGSQQSWRGCSQPSTHGAQDALLRRLCLGMFSLKRWQKLFLFSFNTVSCSCFCYLALIIFDFALLNIQYFFPLSYSF